MKAGREEVCCCTGAHTHRPTGSLAGAPVTPGSRDKDRHPPGRGREKGEGRRSGKARGRGDLDWKEPRKKEDMGPGQRHRGDKHQQRSSDTKTQGATETQAKAGEQAG